MNDIQYTYFLIGLLVLSFVFNPFMKKKATGSLNAHEFLIINHTLITFLIILYGIYLIYYNKCDIQCFKKLSSKEIIWGIGGAITSIIGSIALIMLLQKDEVSFIMPNVQPIVIVIGALVGYFIFNESMGKYKVAGISLIIFGALAINYDKYVSPKTFISKN